MKKVLAVLSLAVMLSGVISAKTINVPGDYSTIQAAVSNANYGDSIQLKAQTYSERFITVPAKRTIVITGYGSTLTTIEGAGGFGTVFDVKKGASLTLSSLTIQNARATKSTGGSYDKGGAIYCKSTGSMAQIQLFGVTINNCSADSNGGGIFLSNVDFTARYCTFSNNHSDASGGAIMASNSTLDFKTGGNRFYNNSADKKGNDIWQSKCIIRATNTSFVSTSNSKAAASQVSIGMEEGSGRLLLEQCTFYNASGGASIQYDQVTTSDPGYISLTNCIVSSIESGTEIDYSAGTIFKSLASESLILDDDGSNQVNVDPKLSLNSDNLPVLVADSPAINAGVEFERINTDADGQLRDDKPDCGSDEYYATNSRDSGFVAIKSFSARVDHVRENNDNLTLNFTATITDSDVDASDTSHEMLIRIGDLYIYCSRPTEGDSNKQIAHINYENQPLAKDAVVTIKGKGDSLAISVSMKKTSVVSFLQNYGVTNKTTEGVGDDLAIPFMFNYEKASSSLIEIPVSYKSREDKKGTVKLRR